MVIEEKRITYRKAQEVDAGILSEYRVSFLNEVFGIDSHPNSGQLQVELEQFFIESLNDGSVIAWVAEYERKVISTSTLVIWKAPLSYSGLGCGGKRGYILNMYTLDEFRKNGIATVLLDKLIEEAKELNLELVTLHATVDGIRVYKNRGFQELDFPELKLKLI